MKLNEIGSRIKSRRKTIGISQEKLSEMVNVSPHYIYEIERGSKAMSLETLINISISLETSTDYILFGDTVEHDITASLTEKDIELLRDIAVTLKDKNRSIRRSKDMSKEL